MAVYHVRSVEVWGGAEEALQINLQFQLLVSCNTNYESIADAIQYLLVRVTSCTWQTVTNILNIKGKWEEWEEKKYLLEICRRRQEREEGEEESMQGEEIRESENRQIQMKLKKNGQEMNTAEVRGGGSCSSVRYKGRSYKDWWRFHSNMGAKNTENMTSGIGEGGKKQSIAMKTCIVSCLGWISY